MNQHTSKRQHHENLGTATSQKPTKDESLEAATTATTLATDRVGGDGGDVLDAANLQAGAGQGAEGALGTGSGGLGTVATGGADLDVEGGDAELLALGSNILRGQHGSVRG